MVSTKAQEFVSTTATRSEPVRILIADDQADVREALRLLLKAEGFATETVNSPASALEAVQSNEFDIMLMDLKQPVKNGDTVPIKLTLEYPDRKLETVEVKAQVRGLGTSQQSQHQH